MEPQISLDTICAKTTNPSFLNALHACRPLHPLSQYTPRPWTVAAFIARQQPSWTISGTDIEWLETQARERGEHGLSAAKAKSQAA